MPKFIPGRHPNRRFGRFERTADTVWYYYVAKTGTFTQGDAVTGRTSKAKAFFVGKKTNPLRAGFQGLLAGPGPGGTPLLPNEVVEKDSDTTQTITLGSQPIGREFLVDEDPVEALTT